MPWLEEESSPPTSWRRQPITQWKSKGSRKLSLRLYQPFTLRFIRPQAKSVIIKTRHWRGLKKIFRKCSNQPSCRTSLVPSPSQHFLKVNSVITIQKSDNVAKYYNLIIVKFLRWYWKTWGLWKTIKQAKKKENRGWRCKMSKVGKEFTFYYLIQLRKN